MIESAFDFADSVGGVLQEMQALRDAETGMIIEAKIRGASDEEIAQIEAEVAERERRYAVTQVLLQQGMAIANAISGATAASRNGTGCPVCHWCLHCHNGWCGQLPGLPKSSQL